MARHINAGAELVKLMVGGLGKDDEGAASSRLHAAKPQPALMHRLILSLAALTRGEAGPGVRRR